MASKQEILDVVLARVESEFPILGVLNITSKQKILDAVRAKLESELSTLEPCVHKDSEEALQKAKLVADGYAEGAGNAP